MFVVVVVLKKIFKERYSHKIYVEFVGRYVFDSNMLEAGEKDMPY